MKHVLAISLFLFVFSLCASAHAATSDNNGPAIINLKMGVMVLPFNHLKHQKDLKNDCFQCHATKIGKIDGWGKETAHKICIACHELEDKGPTDCRQCHKKQ